MLHDVRQPDSYVHHLMAMGPSYGVSTSEDICNQQGAVVVPQGREFSRELAERVIAHKLIKPLEISLTLEGGLTAQQLYHLYAQSMKEYPDFQVLHNGCKLHRMLAKACKHYEQFPLLVQKLTVLKERLPNIFRQGMFTAYLAMALAYRMRASQQDCLNVFIAGLVHDIGLLHIDPDVVMKAGDFSPEEWRAMQAHTVIGHCILRYVRGLPKSVIASVLEHHERYDGSGYPLGKKGAELGLIGQILGMADTCYAQYMKDLKPKKLGFDALLPLLQLNPDIYCRKVYKTVVELIKEMNWPERRAYNNQNIPHLVDRLVQENKCINHDYCVLYGIVMSLRQEAATNHQLQTVINMGERINRSLLSSGMLQSEHGEWMQSTCDSQEEKDFVAIERLELMYAEIGWQIKQLRHMIYGLWKGYRFKKSGLRKVIHQGLVQIEQFHKLSHADGRLH